MLDPDDIAKWLSKAFDSIDGGAVKAHVDEEGLDEFISNCAKLAAGTGFASGAAGPGSVIAFFGLDMANYFYQQIRITLAVIYARTGRYQIGFEEALVIMATALGAHFTGVAAKTAGRTIVAKVGKKQVQQMAVKYAAKLLPASLATKILPGIGGVLGASFNYLLLQSYGRSLAKLDDSIFGDGEPPAIAA
jgi:hypothetical protein